MQHFIHGDVCYLNEYLNAYSYRAEVIYLENISNKQWLNYLKVGGGSWNSTFLPLPFIPIFSLLSSSLFPFPPPPPLEVGPLNPARGSGDRCMLPSVVWGSEPLPKLKLVHLRLKI